MSAAAAGPGAHRQRDGRRGAEARIDRQEGIALAPRLLDEFVARVAGEGFLDDVGLGAVRFRTRVIGTQQEAEQAGFLSSPTILIDGQEAGKLNDDRPVGVNMQELYDRLTTPVAA